MSRNVGGDDQPAWHRLDWPSVRVDGVSSAGTRRAAAWGRHDDGRVVVGLIEGGSLAQVVDVPTDTARPGGSARHTLGPSAGCVAGPLSQPGGSLRSDGA